jgi:hypothetical protein
MLWDTAISAGEAHTYQLQRKGSGSQAEWRPYVDGILRAAVSTPMMTNGQVALGAESANWTGGYGTPGHQNLNMEQAVYRSVYFHTNGQASTNPPGTTNMTWATDYQFANPQAQACHIERPYDSNSLWATGSC